MASKYNFNQLSPAESGFYMPAEWVQHQRCWMAWPSAHVQWDNLSEVEQGYANVANSIAQFEPVTMVADPGNLSSAKHLCGENVSVVSMPLDDSWMRDSGPSFVCNNTDSSVAGIDWRFNA
jgi:agmatine deiminase